MNHYDRFFVAVGSAALGLAIYVLCHSLICAFGTMLKEVLTEVLKNAP